eukprot:8056187-Karenia_brevis.AAC.1
MGALPNGGQFFSPSKLTQFAPSKLSQFATSEHKEIMQRIFPLISYTWRDLHPRNFAPLGT